MDLVWEPGLHVFPLYENIFLGPLAAHIILDTFNKKGKYGSTFRTLASFFLNENLNFGPLGTHIIGNIMHNSNSHFYFKSIY